MATEEDKSSVVVPRSAADVQRMKLEKLMKNPTKPVVIPEGPKSKLPRVFKPPEFVRNIWGSSAGAGSGDFHVYRGIRRREYARQKFDKEKAVQDELEDKFVAQREEKQRIVEEKSARKRAKRQKKKQKLKAKKLKPNQAAPKEKSESEDEDEDEDEEGKDEAQGIEDGEKKADSVQGNTNGEL